MEIGRGVHTGTAMNRSNGLLQLPSFCYIFMLCSCVWMSSGGIVRHCARVRDTMYREILRTALMIYLMNVYKHSYQIGYKHLL